MKRHAAREWTVEEFNDWSAASDRFDAVGQAADEEGGPGLSLGSAIERGADWPTDLLLAAVPMATTNIGTFRGPLRRPRHPARKIFSIFLPFASSSISLPAYSLEAFARVARRARTAAPANGRRPA